MKRRVISTFCLVLFSLTMLILVGCEDNPTTETPVTFNVTLDADNGTKAVVIKVEEGKVATKPSNPSKVGFTFDDWYLGSKAYVFSTPVTKDITLVAKYKTDVVVTDFTVSFNSVGGNSVSSQVVSSGGVATAPLAPSKNAFSFEQWLLGGVAYDFASAVTKDITLDAQYSFVGIPNSPAYEGRLFNPDFDQLINNFKEGTIISDMLLNAHIDEDQPYLSIGYSGEIGNNPNGALWKQAGSENGSAPAFQYLVLRLRGFEGASINDLSIGFRLDDNHEILSVKLTDTFDPDLENNVRELDDQWHNYVISITDTLDGLEYVGKKDFSNVPATGVMVGFHLMNTSKTGSGILEIKDAYYSKLPNPIYPYEGNNYTQNKNYWSETIGVTVSTYVTVDSMGFYGEYLAENVGLENTHVVLRMKQDFPGVLDMSKLLIAPIFENGEAGTAVAFSEIAGMPSSLGSGFINVAIPFAEIYDGVAQIAGYKLINDGDIAIAIAQSFLTYLGDYEVTSYPVLDFGNVLVYDNFNRLVIGTTSDWTADNENALNNGFSYLISYSGLQASTIADGHITLDSTGGDFVSYKVHSISKANQNEYRYLVFKYKLNDGASLDGLRMSKLSYSDAPSNVIYANMWQAGLGLPSIAKDASSYPYVDGDWSYLIVDLMLTEGYSTDVAGFELYYTGSSISFDAIFFANQISNKDLTTQFMWGTFEGLELGTAQGKASDNQYWANVYDSATTIVSDGDSNQALQLDGTDYAQYHTGIKGSGRYLAFDLKVSTIGVIESFRVGPTGQALYAKDKDLILENGTPMVVNPDGQWHHYVIDWVASGFAMTDTIGFHASDGQIYLLDNLSWYSEQSYFDEELVWGSWDGILEGNANEKFGDSQYWAWNYGSATSFVEVAGNMMLKLDASAGYVQYHTGVMAKPRYIAFDLTVEALGSLGINVGGVHKWNADLIGLDGQPVMLPAAGSTGRIIIDVVLSGLPYSDEFGIEANDGAVFFIDNLSFQWEDSNKGLYPMLVEDFDATPANDAPNYWWGEWALVADGTVNLVAVEYAALRFGSPLIANANFITFDVKLALENNADSFRLELGDGNIVNWTKLVEDGVVSNVGAEFVSVTINLSDYVSNLNGLQVIGFHINGGGVIIDNLMISDDIYGNQMQTFDDAPIE